jgi:hypothetical protein
MAELEKMLGGQQIKERLELMKGTWSIGFEVSSACGD